MKGETTIRRWDQLTITVKISRTARLRLKAGVLLMKLAAIVIGCEFEVIDTARNDNAGDDMPLEIYPDAEANAEIRDAIRGYISTSLVADLFGVDTDRVARDVVRARIDLAREMGLL